MLDMETRKGATGPGCAGDLPPSLASCTRSESAVQEWAKAGGGLRLAWHRHGQICDIDKPRVRPWGRGFRASRWPSVPAKRLPGSCADRPPRRKPATDHESHTLHPTAHRRKLRPPQPLRKPRQRVATGPPSRCHVSRFRRTSRRSVAPARGSWGNWGADSRAQAGNEGGEREGERKGNLGVFARYRLPGSGGYAAALPRWACWPARRISIISTIFSCW